MIGFWLVAAALTALALLPLLRALLRPPVTGYTALLWGGPFALLLLAGMGTALYMRQRRRDIETMPAPVLTAAEEARLAALLQDEKPGDGR